MTKPPKPLTIRLGELRPVVDAVELTKGLRGKIVGGKKRLAHLVPVEGGMTVDLFGSTTFVPIATGALVHALRVDADLLAGFLRNSTSAFHPAEIVSFDLGPDTLIARCGTLRVTLQLGTSPSSPRKEQPPAAAMTAKEMRPPEPEKEPVRAEKTERPSDPPKDPPHADESDQDKASATGPTEADLRLSEAEGELDRIEGIERKLQLSKRQRPDYKGASFVMVGWITLVALSELVFGGDILAFVVVISSAAFFAGAWTDSVAELDWKKERWREKDQIPEILKRIELLGFSARQEPSRWVLKPKTKKTSPEAD
jgi:hypothetical protein